MICNNCYSADYITPAQKKILTGLTILVVVGEIFFILSALQILPSGVNAISQLSLGAKIGMGVLIPITVLLAGMACGQQSNEDLKVSTHETNDSFLTGGTF